MNDNLDNLIRSSTIEAIDKMMQVFDNMSVPEDGREIVMSRRFFPMGVAVVAVVSIFGVPVRFVDDDDVLELKHGNYPPLSVAHRSKAPSPRSATVLPPAKQTELDAMYQRAIDAEKDLATTRGELSNAIRQRNIAEVKLAQWENGSPWHKNYAQALNNETVERGRLEEAMTEHKEDQKNLARSIHSLLDSMVPWKGDSIFDHIKIVRSQFDGNKRRLAEAVKNLGEVIGGSVGPEDCEHIWQYDCKNRTCQKCQLVQPGHFKRPVDPEDLVIEIPATEGFFIRVVTKTGTG